MTTMINKVILMGRLTADAELRATTTDKYVANFSIAVERDFKQNGERQADFINLVAWNKTAEFITKYFSKGDMIAVQGTLQTRSYEKDGIKRTITEVLVEKASFCGGKTEKKEEPREFEPVMDDDADLELPF
jgi:single-strand DNA-binding protein